MSFQGLQLLIAKQCIEWNLSLNNCQIIVEVFDQGYSLLLVYSPGRLRIMFILLTDCLLKSSLRAQPLGDAAVGAAS